MKVHGVNTHTTSCKVGGWLMYDPKNGVYVVKVLIADGDGTKTTYATVEEPHQLCDDRFRVHWMYQDKDLPRHLTKYADKDVWFQSTHSDKVGIESIDAFVTGEQAVFSDHSYSLKTDRLEKIVPLSPPEETGVQMLLHGR